MTYAPARSFPDPLAVRLLALRESRGLTQTQLAQVAGVPQSAVSRIEGGRRDPRVSELRALAHALGVPPAALLA